MTQRPHREEGDPKDLWAYIVHLEREVQSLCHEQRSDCPRRFAEGCVKYNRELFGDRAWLCLLNPVPVVAKVPPIPEDYKGPDL